MKAAIISRASQTVAANIEFVDDWPDPIAGPGEAVIKTEASALNHLDLWVGMGPPGLNLQYPRIGGSDGAGMIESVGDGVDESWLGRRVVLNAAMPIAIPAHPDIALSAPLLSMIGEHVHGTHAEKFIAPIDNVLSIDEADPVEAAAFALTHLTVWRMLKTKANIRPGQTVLITGIGGGVALAALNICKHFGCRIIVTSRHQSKLDRAIELGADDGVLDEGGDFSKQVRALTAKRGADICVDSVGKIIHLSCIKSLARGGVFVTCGCTTGFDAVTDLARLFWNQLSLVGSTMGDMDEFREVTALLLNAAMRPVIDSVHDACDAKAAYARLESGVQFGKVVLRW